MEMDKFKEFVNEVIRRNKDLLLVGLDISAKMKDIIAGGEFKLYHVTQNTVRVNYYNSYQKMNDGTAVEVTMERVVSSPDEFMDFFEFTRKLDSVMKVLCGVSEK